MVYPTLPAFPVSPGGDVEHTWHRNRIAPLA